MAFGDPQQGLPGFYLSRHIPAAYSKRSTPTEKPEARQKKDYGSKQDMFRSPL